MKFLRARENLDVKERSGFKRRRGFFDDFISLSVQAIAQISIVLFLTRADVLFINVLILLFVNMFHAS